MTGLVRYGLWPCLIGAALAAIEILKQADIAPLIVVFNLVYVSFAVLVFIFERRLPFERTWLTNDGQILPDLAHTLFNKGIVQVMFMVGGAFGIAELVAGQGPDLWPDHWPMAVQVLLGLMIAEFGLYWAHRLAHQVPLLWRFHAVHHSARRLWFLNTGRFHVVDTLTSIALSQPLLFLAGAPLEVFQWVSMVTAFVGMLTHCNIAMKFGPLSYVFNTAELHRWHHSMDVREGNRNYGENLMIFDQLFGTYFNAARRPPAVIGIREAMPATFRGQLVHPFRRP